MIYYEGKRRQSGVVVLRHELPDASHGGPLDLSAKATVTALRLRLDIADHSPTGFEWSYAGSGPAQLALALLADALGDEDKALTLHQAYKQDVITRLPQLEWQLTEQDVIEAAQRLADAVQDAWPEE